jgi:hypothetical protein
VPTSGDLEDGEEYGEIVMKGDHSMSMVITIGLKWKSMKRVHEVRIKSSKCGASSTGLCFESMALWNYADYIMVVLS